MNGTLIQGIQATNFITPRFTICFLNVLNCTIQSVIFSHSDNVSESCTCNLHVNETKNK